ncbi:MAG TPA: phage minor head protein [Rhodocyclaceae bacterium]|nr:phage minor head protein [Rhodocyclaceae bacterium]
MAIEAADLKILFGLAPEQAVEYMKQKGYAVTWNWWEMRDAAHAKALTIAKVTRADILQDFHQALVKAVEQGTTERDFARALTPVLQAKGWWGKQIVVSPDGGAEVVQTGSPWRLKTIFQTNLQSAYMSGRYQQMAAARDSHPWWQYVAILDSRTRPAHRALHGKVFSAYDPIWKFIWPPNDYNCRCRVRPLTDAQLKEEKLQPMSSGRRIVPVETEVGPDKRTGEMIKVRRLGIRLPGPDGKDIIFSPGVGFNGNPGIDWTASFADLVDQRLMRADALIGAELSASTQPLLSAGRAESFRAWAKAAIEAGQARNEIHAVGALEANVVRFMEAKGLPPETASVTLRDTELLHLYRETKLQRGAAISEEDLLRLPQIMEEPKAVLYDSEDPALLFVFDSAAGDQVGKVVVRVNYTVKTNVGGVRDKVVTNSIRTAGIVKEGDLRGARYVIVSGGL